MKYPVVDIDIDKIGLNSSLKKIQNLTNRLFCTPTNVGKTFGSAYLDNLCQDIGRITLQTIGENTALEQKNRQNIAVYIASKLQSSGGHTAVLRDTIRLSSEKKSIILVTNTCGSTKRKSVFNRFNDIQNLYIEYAPSGNHLKKLKWLQIRLLELCPRNVWLFNHSQDSVAVASVQPNQGYNLKFYHHADDRLSLGVCLAYAQHYDSNPNNFYCCRDVLGIENNQYLPLTASDYGVHQAASEISKARGLVTCTAASHNKIEVDYFIRYEDIIPDILKVTGGQHIHIGHLTPMARNRINKNLARLGFPVGRFIYIPFVSSVWDALKRNNVNLYISSFPYGAGRTSVEVMGAGVPLVVHRHHSDRMIGGVDLVYKGALIWRYPDELFYFLNNVNSDLLKEHSRRAREWYDKYHATNIAQKVLEQSPDRPQCPKLSSNFTPDFLLQSLSNDCEFSFLPLIKAMAWRNYRRWKSYIGLYF
ncbi:tetratricopeptide repeat protein [Spartinivicinus ruber]|uniref:hypothetical protein n=1 Tax=Spartinivicinus ruber TaxID=2683272 RepID=UPI0013D0E680|nr:hypothetical protein [Spartinivicinus ruber]